MSNHHTLSPLSLAMMTERRLFCVALISRVLLFCLMIGFDRLVPEYDSCSHLQMAQLRQPLQRVSESKPFHHPTTTIDGRVDGGTNSRPSSITSSSSSSAFWWYSPLVAPFVNHWDGVHFLHIARFGYTHENICAFYPLVSSVVMGSYGRAMKAVFGDGGSASAQPQFNPFSVSYLLPAAPLFAAMLGWVCFAISTILLRRITAFYLFYQVYPCRALVLFSRGGERVKSSATDGDVECSLVGSSSTLILTKQRQHQFAEDDHAVDVVDSSVVSSTSPTTDPILQQQHSGPLTAATLGVPLVQGPTLFIGVALCCWLCTPAAAFTVVAYTENYFSFFSFLGIWLLTIPLQAQCSNDLDGSTTATTLWSLLRKSDGGSRILSPGVAGSRKTPASTTSPKSFLGPWMQHKVIVLLAAFSFTGATLVRSNGILLCGFLLYPSVNTLGRWVISRTGPFGRALRRWVTGRVLPTNSLGRGGASSGGTSLHQHFWIRWSLPNSSQGISTLTLVPKHSRQIPRSSAVSRSLDTLLRYGCCILVVAPYLAMNYTCHARFCSTTGGSVVNYVANTPHGHFPDCHGTMGAAGHHHDEDPGLGQAAPGIKWPDMYAYVQLKYWGVGWFKYYTVNNIPNFLIAAPLYIVVLYALSRKPHVVEVPGGGGATNTVAAARTTLTKSLLPFPQIVSRIISSDQMGYFFAMLLLAATRMHIQVVTRFVLSCPALYWLLSDLLLTHWSTRRCCGQGTRRGKVSAYLPEVDTMVVSYLVLWGFLSMAMFANFFPWT